MSKSHNSQLSAADRFERRARRTSRRVARRLSTRHAILAAAAREEI